MLLVDGLGIGPEDAALNPVHGGACPAIERLIREQAVPVDTTMAVSGLPQSATGQTALLTGVNAAEIMGRHVEAFPGPRLKEVIRGHNVYDKLQARGYRSTFANAYYLDDVREVAARRIQSVTTVAALQAFGAVRTQSAMVANQAVYHDLTRACLRERGYEGPLVTPEDAAQHLIGIAREYDFTLFEYFQTDRMAHKGTAEQVATVLRDLDRLVAGLLAGQDPSEELLVLTSDHGNIEDNRVTQHTLNPVPLIAVGLGAESLRRQVRAITDVVPALLTLYPPKGG